MFGSMCLMTLSSQGILPILTSTWMETGVLCCIWFKNQKVQKQHWSQVSKGGKQNPTKPVWWWGLGQVLLYSKSIHTVPVMWQWKQLDLKSHQDMGNNWDGSQTCNFLSSKTQEISDFSSCYCLKLGWKQKPCPHTHLSGGESLLKFCLWSFLHLGEPQGPVQGNPLPCTACPSISPCKWSKTTHKLPPTHFEPEF